MKHHHCAIPYRLHAEEENRAAVVGGKKEQCPGAEKEQLKQELEMFLLNLIDDSGRPNLYTHQISDLTSYSEELTADDDNDDEDEDVTLHMKHALGLKRDQCNELQKDLEKFAQAFWEQSEELNHCKMQIKKLQTENEELRCLKWVENEVDAMWAEVKKFEAKSERRDRLGLTHRKTRSL